LDLYCDRVIAARRQSFMVAVYSITYRTPQGRGTIEVAGREPRVLPLANWKPLQLRLATLAIATIVYLVAATTVPLIYGAEQSDGSRGSSATFASALAWSIGLATVFVMLLKSETAWHLLRRRLPRRFGGRLRGPRMTGSVTQTFGTR
jgi:hypothetical protein